MLKPVGLFGVRKRLNQIVTWVVKTDERLDNAVNLFRDVFRRICKIHDKAKENRRRVKSLEKWRIKRMAISITDAMSDKINEECLQHALETIEALEARIVSLEEQLSPPDENPKTSETDND